MDDTTLTSRLRRGPWAQGADLNNVFRQLDAIHTIPGGVAQDIGEPPEYTRYIQSGIRNGDFAALPPDTASDISDIANKLPDWTLVNVQGSSITVRAIADASAASGYVIRFTHASGTVNDEVYLEQITPIVSNRKGAWAAWVNAFFLAASLASATFSKYVVATYLKSDAVTTTGSTDTSTSHFSLADDEPTAQPGVSGTIPGDARYLRIRIGSKRDVTNATTGYIDLCDVFLNTGGDAVIIPDDVDNTSDPASIIMRSGVLWMTSSGFYGQNPALVVDQSRGVVYPSAYPLGARVRRTANQTISDATDESINFTGTEDFDLFAMHDTSSDSNRLVVPDSGYYLIGGGVTFAADGTGDRNIYLEVNGKDGGGTAVSGSHVKVRAATGTQSALNTSTLYHLNAGDYISLTAYQTSGGGLVVPSATMWALLQVAD
jgi:hypothetical protein